MGHPTPPAWYVISLRPQGGHDALRRAAARHGAGLLALSPWRISRCDDDASRDALRAALASPVVVFTSPAAVSAAQALQPLRDAPGQSWLAVGSGTAAALNRAGIHEVAFPERMDSEGLLALPELADLHGTRLGFVTAPDGRNLLVPTLEARGAEIHRAEVYRRESVPLGARALTALAALQAPACLLLSSGGALQEVLAQLPDSLAGRFRALPVVAASGRLADAAHEAGFAHVVLADGPRPAQLVKAACTVRPDGIR
ncbi:uroporphyrinogen-III synthase [Pseudoxanthomonas sp. PXM02]|uniref:uroporphyrinogen-III synthase n=1 Tax=Pseudoxanthomonas sp. PXM02 TaxID=2769294 RepID=UPI001780D477|nr:uroporphyrinogen-III synthase [Pseudoxanthomonas sp. PXM02]MBD9480473.1 uroporphyrinogen-III synthase [Pseudoxanthomonas sp. PXM02]